MKNRTGELREEIADICGGCYSDIDVKPVVDQLLKACKEYLVFRDGREIDIPQAHKQCD